MQPLHKPIQYRSVRFTCTNQNRFTAVHEKFRNCSAGVQWCGHGASLETNDEVPTRCRPYFCSLNLRRPRNVDRWQTARGQSIKRKHFGKTRLTLIRWVQRLRPNAASSAQLLVRTRKTAPSRHRQHRGCRKIVNQCCTTPAPFETNGVVQRPPLLHC